MTLTESEKVRWDIRKGCEMTFGWCLLSMGSCSPPLHPFSLYKPSGFAVSAYSPMSLMLLPVPSLPTTVTFYSAAL